MTDSIAFPLTDGLVLSYSDCDYGLAADFRTHFLDAWRNLPEIVRSICSMHWQSGNERPVILLHSFGLYRDGVSGGNVRNHGNEIRYNIDVFTIIPPVLRNTVIAHEVGHVFFNALDESMHLTGTFSDLLSCEYINCHLTGLWGFDQQGVSSWLERELCDGKPILRSTIGEKALSDEEYKLRVDRSLLNWGKARGCNDLLAARTERDELLHRSATYFDLGTLSDSRFAALREASLDAFKDVVHGRRSLAELESC